MPPFTDPPPANRLLAKLHEAERTALAARAHPVTLTFSEMVAEAHQPLPYIYFPTGAYLALIATTEEQKDLGLGLIGGEGMVGGSLLLGLPCSPTRVVVQGSGPALRLEPEAFREALDWGGDLESLIKRYIHVWIAQLAQTAACGHYHRLEERLARWLLVTRDRAHADTFPMTHESLASLLGVRRTGVTRAASALHRRRLIQYHRGTLTILDPQGLMAAACGCYAHNRAIYLRTLG